MRLIALGVDERGRGWRGDEPALSGWQGYPGAVRMRVRFPAGRQGGYEPLVVTGTTGAGNLLYVIYQDAAHVRLGFDHWGIGGVLSDPLRVEWNTVVELTISMGSLYPPDAPANHRCRLMVTMDGQTIFDQEQAFHPSRPQNITFGLNLIGGGTAHAEFTGAIDSISPAQAR